MSCGDFERRLLDDGPRGADVEAHVAQCASCQALKRAHLEALALRGVVPGWRRARKASVVVRLAFVLVAVGVVGGVLVSSRPVAPGLADSTQPGPRLEGQLMVADAAGQTWDDEQAWAELVALTGALTRPRDVMVSDVTYASFGSLPEWVAPTAPDPLGGLGEAGSPLSYSKED